MEKVHEDRTVNASKAWGFGSFFGMDWWDFVIFEVGKNSWIFSS